MSRRRSLGRCERGTSLIELALGAPLLAALLIGMVDLSNAYSTKLQLEQAAQRTVEKVMQRQLAANDNSAIQAEATSAAGTGSSATADHWLECNGTRQTDYASVCPDGQVNRRYVTVTVNRDFMPLFGTRFFPGANSNGSITIRVQAGVRVQ